MNSSQQAVIKEFIKTEYKKCAKDPIYYLNNYGHVFDATEKKIKKMKCYSYQERCVRDFHTFQNNIVLKSRQCLPKNTLIDTPSGFKNIQDLKKGDLVYSYNIETNKVEIDTVIDAWCSGEVQCMNIDFYNIDCVEVGENHPLYNLYIKDWTLAKDLKKGDVILNKNKGGSRILGVNKTTKKMCYDISVEKNENFFLSNGLLVHNTGLSVVTAGYVAWRLMFRYEEKIMIIANKGDGAIRFLNTVKEFVNNTPKWLQPSSVIKNNETELRFSNKSWVQAKASSPEAGRGESLTMLVLDETAFIKDDDDIWMGAGMSLSVTNGKCIMISTPSGTGNLYHRTWVGSVNGDNDFNNLKVHWTENPNSSKGLILKKDLSGNDIYWSPWYEEQCRRLNNDSVKIAQELDLSFEGSKYLAIPNDIIEKYEKRVRGIKPIYYIKYDFLYKGESKAGSFVLDETNFHVWKKPEKDHSYLVSSDIARGDGADYSTIEVLDVDTMEQVAEFREKIGTDLLPYILNWVGLTYNEAFIVTEANSFGLGVGFSLRDKFNYKRLFYSKNTQDIHVRPYDYKIPQGVEIPGFQTSRTTRPFLVTAIIEHMREGNLILNSPRLLAEMSTFIMKGDRPEAEGGFNDDLIFALGIALYIRDTEYKNIKQSTNMTMALLDAFTVSNNSMEGQIMYKKESNKDIDAAGGLFIFNNKSELELDDSDDDLSWLMK